MSTEQIIRAWKDPGYRENLREAERATLPANPAGAISLNDGELNKVSGGVSIPHTVFCTKPPTICTYWVYCL
jgi:mersacidin/lichenicidin family type 2 lantibiotic